jgi:hypothetical protein
MGLCVAPTCASREEFQGISGQCAVPSSRQGNVFLPSEHFICGVRASHYYNYNNMYIHIYIVIYIYPEGEQSGHVGQAVPAERGFFCRMQLAECSWPLAFLRVGGADWAWRWGMVAGPVS